MITYNPKDWFRLIFHFHKSDTFRILLPTMLLLGAITAAVAFAENRYLSGTFPSLTVFHQISGFIIALVLVFRINTAYDRWWEGRKLWGSLVNNCRNLALQLNCFLPEKDPIARQEMLDLLGNYPFSLKEHLRVNSTVEDIRFNQLLNEVEYRRATHKPNFIASRLYAQCLNITMNHVHSPNDFLVLNPHLTALTDICGACERIRSTPIPYSYSLFIKKIIFLYIITMPFGFGVTLGYWSVPMVMIMFYAFASLEIISEEIEEPFGSDSNDLPTDEISVRIKNNIREILLPDGN
jgi:putative membrane protein